MELVLPSVTWKTSFLDAVKEYQADAGHYLTQERYDALSLSEMENDFDGFVQKELSHARGENLPAGYVPETDYWLIDADEYIGSVRIRHRLSEHLNLVGGHIGYDIRPSKRQRGYGGKILELALPKARELGIKRALLTADETNGPSRKIIERNGGVLENIVENPETGIRKARYWITVV